MVERTGQNELTLVCAARDGDRDALRTLFARNWNWIKGLVYSVVGNSNELDDILQDICVRVIDKIGTLKESECFQAWLAAVARRAALQHCRCRSRRRVALSDQAAQEKPDETALEPLEDIERTEEHQQILEAIRMLPEKYREVFLLAHSKELTYRQISEVLDIPLTTVQIRLVRARRMIYQRITGKETIAEE